MVYKNMIAPLFDRRRARHTVYGSFQSENFGNLSRLHSHQSRATNQERVISIQDVGPEVKRVGVSLSIIGRPWYDNTKLWLYRDTVGTESVNHLEWLTLFNFSNIQSLHHIVQSGISNYCVNCPGIDQSRLHRCFSLSG
jgi:hypothetical protein